MKVVILAGGFGTRLSEETTTRPKPMVEVGGKPILWHLMTHYASYGFNEFIVALGYKQDIVKEYFRSLYSAANDLSIDFSSGSVSVVERHRTNWIVHLIDTGLTTMTGGRLKRLESTIGNDTFMCTYGDGLSSVNLTDLLAHHRREGREATVTGVRPPARFGVLEIEGTRVTRFAEKPQTSEGWINGGFFVFEPSIFRRISSDDTLLEHEPLVSLAEEGELSVFKHPGFWQPLDTLRDKRHLEDLWASGSPPWVTETAAKP